MPLSNLYNLVDGHAGFANPCPQVEVTMHGQKIKVPGVRVFYELKDGRLVGVVDQRQWGRGEVTSHPTDLA